MANFHARREQASFWDTEPGEEWDVPFDPSRSTNISDQEYLKKLCPQMCDHECDSTPVQCVCGKNIPAYTCKRCKDIVCSSCDEDSLKEKPILPPPINNHLLPSTVKIRDDGMFIPNQWEKGDKTKFRIYLQETLKHYSSGAIRSSKKEDRKVKGQGEFMKNPPTLQVITEHTKPKDSPAQWLSNIQGSSRLPGRTDNEGALDKSETRENHIKKLRAKLEKGFSQSKTTLRQAVLLDKK